MNWYTIILWNLKLIIKYKMSEKYTTIKNEKELQIMRELAKVHKEVFEEIRKTAKVWTTWKEINDLCENITTKYWVLCWFKWVYGFPWNICLSLNDCVVHGVPWKKIIFKNWDVIKFDFWVKCPKTWLNTDRAFTMIIWDWPHKQEIEKFLNVCKEALYKWVAKAIVWNRVWDISNAIQKHVESAWFYIVKDLTWHGIWYWLHEKPYIPNFWQAKKGDILKENMTLAIEPIIWFSSWKIKGKWWFEIYIADWSLWAQFEHTIVVKPNYPEIII